MYWYSGIKMRAELMEVTKWIRKNQKINEIGWGQKKLNYKKGW